MKRILYTMIGLFVLSTGSWANNALIGKCSAPTASIYLEINNVRAKLLNGGDMFWEIFGDRNGSYEIPKGSGKNSLFTAALMMTGYDAGGTLYSAGQTYRQRGLDFWPGPLNQNAEIDSLNCLEWDKMFNMYKTEIMDAKNGRGVSFNIAKWPSQYAPFKDMNSDGIYDPSQGDYPVLNANTPDNIPDQMVFWIFNDKGNNHTAYPGGSSLGVEIHATAYAYASKKSEVINNSTIYKYRIFNKSVNTYQDFRVGKFLDPDVGIPDDDYVGCDVSRSLFYAYNATNYDDPSASTNVKGYGDSPPAVGIKILNTDKNDNGLPLGMGSYMHFTNQGIPRIDADPMDAIELARYFRSLWADGQHLVYGTPSGRDGNDNCNFAFPGTTDPAGRPNWVESQTPGDRRSIFSTNSKTFEPGGVTEFEFAVVWAHDTPGTAQSNIAKLQLSSDTLYQAYLSNFSNFSTGIQQTKKQLQVFPNPSADFIYVKGLVEKTEVKIYTSGGKLIKTQTIFVEEKIDIKSLPSGVYFIQSETFRSRFVKL